MSGEQWNQKTFLEIMVAEQLEELLRKDAAAENSQFSGEDILEIMAVIYRKRNDIVEPQSKIDIAWHDFKENYLGNSALYIPNMDEEAEPVRKIQSTAESIFITNLRKMALFKEM